MIDEGNLLRFVQVRGTVVCHMLAPMSWPMSSWNHRMKGRAMSHPLRTWVARPALCCCQMPYFMDDPDRFSEAGQKHWPELMETHSETLAYPHPVVMPTVDLKKKSLVLRNPWHPFAKKLKKIWGGTLKIWTLKCKVVPQLMEITSHLWWREARLQHPAKKGREHSRSKRMKVGRLQECICFFAVFCSLGFSHTSRSHQIFRSFLRFGNPEVLAVNLMTHHLVLPDAIKSSMFWARKDGRFHQRLTSC